MEKTHRMHLFHGYGIELEYMIVDRDTLDVRPISDELIKKVAGKYQNEWVNGPITWSNEIVLHLIELKCTKPVQDLRQLQLDFHRNIQEINEHLASFNAKLMPSGAHPWMNPEKETFLWPHDQSDIYDRYNKIFNCQGHGWSNLQSTHINLPFYDDEEFAALHTAARLILPIIPGLSASTPILNENYTGYHDKRLVYYKNNQRRIPSITGKIIPERVVSRRQYQKLVYDKIASQVAPYNEDHILDPVWLNSRGIIARFDRGSIEIRIIDIQECPLADLAVVILVSLAIRLLVEEKLCDHKEQLQWEIEPLYKILKGCIRTGHLTSVSDTNYLNMLGMSSVSTSVKDIWIYLLGEIKANYPETIRPWQDVLEELLNRGTLAYSILETAQKNYSRANLGLIYQELSNSLATNRLFEPCDHTISL
jgi:carboxylate-amine ligase